MFPPPYYSLLLRILTALFQHKREESVGAPLPRCGRSCRTWPWKGHWLQPLLVPWPRLSALLSPPDLSEPCHRGLGRKSGRYHGSSPAPPTPSSYWFQTSSWAPQELVVGGLPMGTCQYFRYFFCTRSLVMSFLGSPKIHCLLPG